MRLFEFGDLAISPSLYHVYLRRFLFLSYKVYGFHRLWVPAFSEFLKNVKSHTIMDCCSGTGEPLLLLNSEIRDQDTEHINYLLSDFRPQQEFIQKFVELGNKKFQYIPVPIDATKEQEKFNYPKIFINSFHHFSKDQVEKILETNFRNKNEVIIMEYVRNSPLGYLSVLVGTCTVFLLLPFMVQLKHFPVMALFTYVIPIFPLMILWDGFVSCAHEYSAKDLEKIVNKLPYECKLTSSVKRSLLFPAGVSVITFTFT